MREKLSVKQMNFFEQGENAVNPEETVFGDNVHYCLAEDRKMVWMREKIIMLFMRAELESCGNELGWLIRCHNCSVDNCSEENYPPRLLLIPPGYIETLERKLRKAIKGIFPPTLKIILKTHYPIPVRQAPVHPQQQKISPCSPSRMPCNMPESLRENQTNSSYFGAQADGTKEEQIETLLKVESNDMMGKH